MSRGSSLPWQLRMFEKTLKKRLRLNAFRRLLGTIKPTDECLLLTCGDNNGAINYHLRLLGGNWSWADMEDTGIDEMASLLGDEVRLAKPLAVPFPDGVFDLVLAIDVHEHVEDPIGLTQELARMVKEGGRVLITVPGGNPKKLVNRLKHASGMTARKYGHVRDGFSSEEIAEIMAHADIEPATTTTFSRFFTELVEFGINYLYVNVLASRGPSGVKEGTIAPQTHSQLKSVEKTYRAYSVIFPFVWMFSQLDRLLFFTEGYVVIVGGAKARGSV